MAAWVPIAASVAGSAVSGMMGGKGGGGGAKVPDVVKRQARAQAALSEEQLRNIQAQAPIQTGIQAAFLGDIPYERAARERALAATGAVYRPTDFSREVQAQLNPLQAQLAARQAELQQLQNVQAAFAATPAPAQIDPQIVRTRAKSFLLSPFRDHGMRQQEERGFEQLWTRAGGDVNRMLELAERTRDTPVVKALRAAGVGQQPAAAAPPPVDPARIAQLTGDIGGIQGQIQQLTGQEGAQGEMVMPALLDVTRDYLARQAEAAQRGAQLTPEQEALINERAAQAIGLGESDINRFLQQTGRTLREELAPGLGLRAISSPIEDRGQIAREEALRQQGQLVRGVRGQAAQQMLDYPLQAGQFETQQRTAGITMTEAVRQFQEQLAQQAFQNRMNLGGTASTVGLQLAALGGQGGFPSFPSGQTGGGGGSILGGVGAGLTALGGALGRTGGGGGTTGGGGGGGGNGYRGFLASSEYGSF